MKSSASGVDRPSYHHGRLKDALIEAARLLLAERGPSGFTLAEAAKRVGVTGAAPYRHFADRQALLDELAARGFAQFSLALRTAYDGGAPDPRTAFKRMGAAYLRFAREEPGLYGAMFGVVGSVANPTSNKSANEALENLRIGAQAALRQMGAPADNVIELAQQIWGLSHGIATLSNSGHLAVVHPGDPGELLTAGVNALLETAMRRASAR